MDIQRDIPAPRPHTGARGRPTKYPFADMQVGDSILVDGEAARPGACKAYGAARTHGDNHGKKFQGKREPGIEGKVRIWRTA